MPRSRRASSRLFLIGSLAALAAAAALLGVRWWNSDQSQPFVAAAPPPAESAPEHEVATSPVPRGPVLQKSTPKAQPVQKDESAPDSPHFIVRVLPLQDRTQDEFSKAAVKAFHAALLQGLRAVPGLTLKESDATGAIAPNEFQLAVTGDGPVQGRWSVQLMLKANLPVAGSADGAAQYATVPHLFRYNSVELPLCTGSLLDHPATGCSDAQGGAASQLYLMRLVAFPTDPSLRRALQARLLDKTADPDLRWQALADLRTARANVRAGASAPQLVEQRNVISSETLRGAVDLAGSAPNPAMRAQIWRVLRGVRQAELVQPLIDSSRLDADDATRLEAVTTLVTDYADDPKARAALESISRTDSRELVRMVAQRALAGDTTWSDYVAARLQNDSLPDAQRLEALSYLASLGDRGQQARGLLDAKAVEALAAILPRALAAQPDPWARVSGQADLASLFSIVSATNQPATVDLISGALRVSTDPMLRRSAVTALARHLDDARARAVLEDIALHDPDPQLRDAASIRQPQLTTPPPGT